MLSARCGTGGGLDAETVGDAAEQGAEFEPAQEAQQRLCLGLADKSLGERHIKRNVGIEDHERPRQPRLVGESDETLSPLRLGDLGGAGEQRVEIAIFVDEQRRGLTPMPGTPGTLSVESPISACTSMTFDGRHAEALHHLLLADHLVLHGVVHAHAWAHELHQVLVGGDDRDVGAGLRRLARVGGDEVVGLVALLLEASDVEGLTASRISGDCGARSSGMSGRCAL